MANQEALMALDGEPEGKLQHAEGGEVKSKQATPSKPAMPAKKAPSKPVAKKKV